MSDARGSLRVYAPRLFLALVVAVGVAVGLGAVPALLAEPAEPPTPTGTTELNVSEYDTDEVVVTAVPARGGLRLDTEGSGTVVIDDSHANALEPERLQPMREALVRAGYTVEVYDGTGGDLATALDDAVGYVVVDPGTEFDEEEVAAVESFTADGGRLLLFAEPTTVSVQASFQSTSILRERSEVSRLTAAYGLSVRTSYVYNVERNDGNFKNPLASPAGPASDVEGPVSLYTAARVVALDGGQPVLRAAPGSRSSGRDATGQFPLAMRTGNVIAVGDATVLDTARYNVGANEAFLAYLFEFLVTGQRAAQTPTPSPTPSGTATPSGTPAPNQTPTPNGTATATGGG